MAGPLTIQRVPRGLLHALAMKGTGDLPTELAPSIVGTYDVTTLYLGDNLRSLSSATSQPLTVDAFYSAPALQVPAGEIWLPLNFTVQSGNSVGDAGNVLLCYRRKSTSGVLLLHRDKIAYSATLDMLGGVQVDPGTLILYPGDDIGITACDITATAGTKHPLVYIDYYRLEV